ncbi:phage tail protein [Actinokineospora sp. G85]|uniref:phage tail protein n=1 Tax=Actinokineospora sp. G85 TaxID=3406626 RepID=UPI003C725A9C
MALSIGELVGYLRVDASAWRRGLGEARAMLSRLARDSAGDLDDLAERARSAGDRAGQAFVGLALSITKVAGAIGTVQGVVPIVVAMGGALALLPALGVAVKVGMFAAQVGMSGFGDALAAVEDPAAFAESLDKLSPAARETALAVRDLAPAWRDVQRATQDALFAGVADEVRELGGAYLPVLKTGLSGITAEFNTAARGTSAFLGQSQQVQTVGGIFGQVRAAIGNTTSALPALVSILLDLVAVGSEFLPNLSGGFGDAAQRAAEFVRAARESGQLREWISSGLSTLRDLGKVLGNLFAIARSVFGALDTGGASLLDTLLRVTGGVREFLDSFEGQQALAALGELLGTVSSVVTSVLLVALRQLAPLVIELEPAFSKLATQVGSTLVTALTTVEPLLLGLAGFLSENISWLGPLGIGLYAAAQAFGAISTAVRVLNVLVSVNPWALLIAATVALATLIVTNWDTITSAVGAAWDWLVSAGKAAWNWIVGIVRGAVDFMVDLFLTWSLPGLIIKHWDSIVSGVRTAVRWVLDAVGRLGELPGRVGAWFVRVKDAVVDRWSEAVAWVRGVPQRILDALGDLGRLLYDTGANIVRGLINGFGSLAGAIRDKLLGLVRGAWDSVLSFFGIRSPSRLAAEAGRYVGEGLVVGLGRMSGKVGRAFLNMAAVPRIPPTVIPAPRLVAPNGADWARGLAPFDSRRGGAPVVHVTNHYPQAEPTSTTVNRSLQYAGALGVI